MGRRRMEHYLREKLLNTIKTVREWEIEISVTHKVSKMQNNNNVWIVWNEKKKRIKI